jgi:hypothetical protein
MEKNEDYHLNKFLITNVLTYLEIKDLLRILPLNKDLHGMISFNKKIADITKEEELLGRQDMNDLYISSNISDHLHKNEKLLFVHMEIESKDQGWASVNYSSSWVDLIIKDQEDQQKDYFNLLQNFKVKDYKKYEIIFNKSKNTDIFNSLGNTNNKFEIRAISMYPGWTCSIKSAKIKLGILGLNY